MSTTPGRPHVIERNARGVEPEDLGDPGSAGNILAHRSGYVKIVSGGAETRTLDDPVFLGQELHLFFETDGGTVTLTTDSAVNQTGNNTLSFADAGDHIMLVGARDGAGDYEWRVVCNDGVGLSTV